MQERSVKLFWPPMPEKKELLKEIEELLWPSDGSRPFVGEGHYVDLFEKKCVELFGADYVLFTNSGTSGLDLALLASGVEAGDEVITTSLTCTATNLAILNRQAKPIFADINKHDLNINPKDIENKITAKTKAIMVVHWGGYPCEMDEINQIAKKHNLKVISDGAHALGAEYKKMPVSKLCDYTMISLQAIKHITTIDGGLLFIKFNNSDKKLVELSKDPTNRSYLRDIFGKVIEDYFSENKNESTVPSDYLEKEVFERILQTNTNDFSKELVKNRKKFSDFWKDWQNAESVRRRRWFGIGRDERVPSPEKGYSSYKTFELGGKYHAHNLCALIGLHALKKFEEWKKKRDKIAETYEKELKKVKGIKLFFKKKDRKSANWLYDIFVERRDDFVKTMAYRGVETSIVHERNDYLPVFIKYGVHNKIPNLDAVNNGRVCIPIHQNLSKEDIDYVIKAIKSGW